MSTAAARAAARRKALSERGTDRLAKLTTTARGEDSPVYRPEEKSLLNPTDNLRNFVGEDSNLPPPIPSSRPAASHRTPSSSASSPPSDPSVWSQEQQMQFMQALMGAGLGSMDPSNQSRPPPSIASPGSSAAQPEDPLAAMMSALTQMNPQAGGQGAVPNPFAMPGAAFQPPPQAPPKPQSRLKKFMPLIHVLATWFLLAYYVFWKEPGAYMTQPTASAVSGNLWQRWADLAWRNAKVGSAAVQFVPFFWAFTTLQVVLHSYRVFSGLDTIQPPMLLSLALPQLPKPLPSVILTGMKYMQIGGAFLDDLAALIFGLGMIVWVATWLSS